MNYKKNYDDLINKIRSLNRKKGDGIYYEEHHILPKSMGGEGKDNLVFLTAREHFLAHYMLYKIYHNKEMSCAFWRMCITNNKGKKFSSRMYEKLRKEIQQKLLGENNPFFNKKHSEKTKQILSEMAKERVGDKNPNFGNKWSEEQKQKMREKMTGRYCGSNNPRARKIINLDTGEIFNSIYDACIKYETCRDNIINSIKGKYSMAKGFHWDYYKG
jgi:hypothetical protein